MIGTVEVIDPAGGNQTVLDSPKCIGRAAANHKGSAIQILFLYQVFLRQRVVSLRDQVDMTCKEIMHSDPGDLPCLFLQGK